MKNKIIHVYSEDYSWIYLNNKKFCEGHTIYDGHWFELGQMVPDVKFKGIKCYEINQEYIEVVADLPDLFSDIPEDKLN